MPTYEYQCQKCKFRFEELQKMSDLPLVKCPKCGGNLKRLISSGTGLIFKGSGFYITDYRKKSHPMGGKKEDVSKPVEKTPASPIPDKKSKDK